MSLPSDSMLLLSVVNTALRDHFSSLEDLAKYYDVPSESICEKLKAIDYTYNKDTNQFI